MGGTGCITGVANLYPKVCLAIYDEYIAGNFEEAQRLQIQLGIAELGFGDGGINGTKWVVGQLLGYPEDARDCRRPYPTFDDKDKRRWILEQVTVVAAEESRLQKFKS